MMTDTLLQTLAEKNIEYKTEYSLREHVSLRLDTFAALALFPRSAEELATAVSLLRAADLPTVLLGRGSNLFFAKVRYEGAVVLTDRLTTVSVAGNRVRAACGVSLTGLAAKVGKMGLSGLEFAYGIPGSVGGAVYMNAGAYGGAMSDVIAETLAFDCDTARVCSICEHDFGYRESIYMKKKNLICLEATLTLAEDDPSAIEARMRGYMQSRKEKQPLEYPSAGSYFKRPEGYFAGKLIEDCGLKGLRVGGAEVSAKHAGFLINCGGATAADILALEETVREAVYTRFGVRLEREVQVIV